MKYQSDFRLKWDEKLCSLYGLIDSRIPKGVTYKLQWHVINEMSIHKMTKFMMRLNDVQ